MKQSCIICKSENNSLIYMNYPGYIEGSFLDIYKCHNCNSHFIITTNNIKEIYDLIYSDTSTRGYDRYYNYAKIIKKIDEPLKYLAFTESTYYPVYKFVKNKTNLNILEIDVDTDI